MVDFNKLSAIHGKQSIKLLGGISGVFTPVVGAPVACSVIVSKKVNLISDDGMRTEQATTIDVSTTEVACVNKNDKFIVAGDSYTVKRELENDGDVIKAQVI